jgi:predicted esterase YcpF (UPF0227 family)
MILFIHGFASCGLGEKSRCLIDRFGRADLLTPDLSHDPAAAVTQLESLLVRYPVDLLVGSSLGGHYAVWLNRRHRVPAVLINPAVAPHRLLARYVGGHQRWCDGATFRLTTAHIAELERQFRPELDPGERYLVLLQAGDEVLDYRAAADYFRAFEVVVLPDGSHRFDRLSEQLQRIEDFRHRTATTP